MKMSYQNYSGSGEKRPGFFKLKDDGDIAFVRFMIHSLEDFELVSCHVMESVGSLRWVKINCLRKPNDPVSKCPLCASGLSFMKKVFIPLIRYTKDNNGEIVGNAEIWERTLKGASSVRGFLEEYGDLTDRVFKIIRHGDQGYKQTDYSIVPMDVDAYTKAKYPIDEELEDLFDEYTVMGPVVKERSFSDLEYLVENGDFPPAEVKTVPANEDSDWDALSDDEDDVGIVETPAEDVLVTSAKRAAKRVPVVEEVESEEEPEEEPVESSTKRTRSSRASYF